MNPYERWDDWEWEKAVQELSRKRDYRSSNNWRPKGSYSRRRPFRPLKTWTGLQKKAALSAVFFLLVFFAAQGEDTLSKGVYTAYKGAVHSGNYYTALNDTALQVLGMKTEIKSTPVDSTMVGQFLPPVSGKVMAGFGQKDEGNGSLHNGIDVASALGIPVVAPYQGIITFVGEDPQLGRVVKLDFGSGWTGVLGNFGDVYVSPGQLVERGEALGTVGLSAPLKKTWLHIELHKDGVPVNPMDYFLPPS